MVSACLSCSDSVNSSASCKSSDSDVMLAAAAYTVQALNSNVVVLCVCGIATCSNTQMVGMSVCDAL